MTGYGKTVCNLKKKKLTIEMRSLNSKQLDLNLRIPSIYREKESEIRNLISKEAERGKIDFTIYSEQTNEEEKNLTINHKLAATYHKELKKLSSILKEKQTNLLPLILKMPDVITSEKREFDEKDWKELSKSISKTIEHFNKFRDDEGKSLQKEFEKRLALVSKHLAEIETLDKKRINNVKERVRKNVAEAIEKSKIDTNRLEQELIYYIEKLDITEEKVRLKTHCEYFLKTMKEDSSGRKLGFISQEIGREINTIGSKANDAEIQKIVVMMKDELEKIKEQINNVL